MTSKTTHAVIDELIQRDAHGLQKYQKTLDRKDLEMKEWLQHAKEEAMDLACYLQRIQQVLNSTENHFEVKHGNFGARTLYLNGIRLPQVISFEHTNAIDDIRRVTIVMRAESVKGLNNA